MPEKLKILIVEDNATDVGSIERELKKAGMAFTAKVVAARKSFRKEVEAFAPDIILADYFVPEFDGLSVIRVAEQHAPLVPLIMVTNVTNDKTAVDCIKAGAVDYVLKEHLAQLAPAVKAAIEKRKIEQEEKQEEDDRRRREEALKKSQELYRTVLGNLNDIVFEADFKGHWTFLNPAWTRISGFAVEESLGVSFLHYVHPDDRDRFLQELQSLANGEVDFLRSQVRFTTKDREVRWIEAVIRLVMDEKDQVAGSVGILTDITDRKAAEMALKLSEERYRQSVENSPNPIFSVSKEGTIQLWNRSCEQLFEYSSKEIIGQEYSLLLWDAQDVDDIERLLREVWDGKALTDQDLTYKCKGGTKRYTVSRLYPLLDDAGDVQECVFANTDVTERKLAEEASRQAEESLVESQQELEQAHNRLAAIIENTPEVAIQGYDETGVIISWNPASEELYGVEENEAVGKHLGGLILSEEDGKEFEELVTEVIATGQPAPVREWTTVTSSGEIRHVLSSLFPIILKDGKGEVVCMDVDITKRKQAEDELRILQEINNAMNAGTPLDDVLRITTHRVRELFDFDACDIFLIAGDGKNITYAALAVDAGILKAIENLTGLKARNLKIPLFDGSIFKKTIEEQKTHITHDMVRVFKDFSDNKMKRAFAGQAAKLSGFKTVIRVPLIAEGEIIGIMGAARKGDITENDAKELEMFGSHIALVIKKAQAEEALRESEKLYRQLFENANDAIFLLSLEGVHVQANRQAADMLGYERDELIGMEMKDVVAPHEYADARTKLQTLLAGQTLPIYERTFRTKAGVDLPVEINVSLVKDAAGNPIYIQSIVRDISERKQAEEALSEANARLKVLQEITAAVHSSLDLEEVFTEITDGIVHSMGYTSAFILTLNDENNRFEMQAVSTGKRVLPQINRILGFPIANFSFPADPEVNPVIRSAMSGKVVVAKTLEEIAYPIINKRMSSALQKLRGTKSYIVVPLELGKKVVGGIVISTRREEVPEEEVRTVKVFAGVASQAIRNATLHIQTKRAEEALRNIAEGVSATTGGPFFQSLVQHLTGTLGVQYAIVGELVEEENRERIKTIAVSDGGKIVSNFKCDLAGSPCENLAEKTKCTYPSEVQRQFPDDHLLVEMGVESYCGTPLFDSAHRVLGALVLMDRKPMEDLALLESTLQVFAVRASAELERKLAEEASRQAEEALRESEKRFRVLFENTPLGYQSLDEDGNIVEVNQSWLDLLGYSREEVVGKFFGDFLNPVSRDAFKERFTGFKTAGSVQGAEFEALRKDGSELIISINGKIGYDEQGKFKQTYCIVHDITDRKQAEDRINQQLDELQRWHRLTLDREDRVQELKREVNELSRQLGEESRYPSQESRASQ